MNPIFYCCGSSDDQTSFQVLTNGNEVELQNGDTFSLLPNQFLYKIRIKDDPKPGSINIRSVDEVNATVSTANIPEIPNIEQNTNKETELHSPKKRILPAFLIGKAANTQTNETTSCNKRSASSNDDQSASKKTKNDDIPENLSIIKASNLPSVSPVSIELPPCDIPALDNPAEAEESIENDSEPETKPVIKKEEPNDSSIDAPSTSNATRNGGVLISTNGERISCRYGIRCFRYLSPSNDEIIGNHLNSFKFVVLGQ